MGFLALLTPLVPLVLVLVFAVRKQILGDAKAFEFPITTAMMVGIVWGIATTWRPGAAGVRLLTRSVIEGLEKVAPAVALMFGIGMLVNAVMHPAVLGSMQPLLGRVLPESPVWYVVGFGVFAPLALYRGPLNIWGMGFGLGKMMAAAMPAPAVMAALLSVGQIQGVCDPTNTHNVWIANFCKVPVGELTRLTLPWVLAVVLVGLVVGVLMFGAGFG